MKKITTPLTDEMVENLEAGDKVLISGIIYTARDSAHKRLVETLSKGESLPIELQGQIIYYAGPSPAPPGKPIGSIGPTTSYRMDPYTPVLLKAGAKGFIGKGERSKEVVEALKKYKGVYFAAVGGAAALLAKRVNSASTVAYPELGPEAIWKLEVEDFPVIVINDCRGNDLYIKGRLQYAES